MVNRHGQIALLSVVWSISACALGPALGAYAFFALDYVDSSLGSLPTPAQFEWAYNAFLVAVMMSGMGVVPLALVLTAYGEMSFRRESLDRSWLGVTLGALPIAALCAATTFAAARVWGQNAENASFLAVPVLPVALASLLTARWLVPGLGPRGFRSPQSSIERLARAAPALPTGVLLAVLLTVCTALVESELVLPSPNGDSNFDIVQCRGLPYPFLQREFLPSVFVYDTFSIGFFVFVGLRCHQLMRRAV